MQKLPIIRGPPSHSMSTKTGEVSRLTRSELEDARRRYNSREISNMAASRKREILLAQRQRASLRGNHQVDSTKHSLDAGVKISARKYNEAKLQADMLHTEMMSRCDELIELEREAKALNEMSEGNNSDSMKIIRLSAEIQEAHHCSESSLKYRHQLHYMHDRVTKNSVIMDGHIGDMSATLVSVKKEREKIQKMLAEVESGLTFASIELDETIRDTNSAEEERNHELANKQLEAGNASRMEKWNQERFNSTMASQQQLLGSLKLDRERIQRAIREKKGQQKELNKQMEELTTELGDLEDSFSRLKQSTGENSLAEIIAKITNHDKNHSQLLKEKKDAEERLKAAKKALLDDQEALERIKTNGFGDADFSRDVVDDIKSSIFTEKSEGKIVKSTNERLEALLVGLRQGGIGLYNRLLPYHSDLLHEEAPKLGEIDSTNAAKAAAETLEMINFTEKILGKMLLDIGGIRYVDTKGDVEKEEGPESPGLNCRIKPKSKPDEDDVTIKTAKEDADPSSDEVLSRDRLKANSEIVSNDAIRLQGLNNKKPKAKPRKAVIQQQDLVDDIAQNGSSLPPNAMSKQASILSPSPFRAKPISSREDPMERVQAFLTELPVLD